MSYFIYGLAAYGAFNLLFVLIYGLRYLRKRRLQRFAAARLASEQEYQQHDGDPMFPGTDPNEDGPMESYLAELPPGTHRGQKSVSDDSVEDAFTRSVDGIAERLRKDLMKQYPLPRKPVVKKGGSMEPFLKWLAECNRINEMIDDSVHHAMQKMDIKSEADADATHRALLEAGITG